MVGVVVVGTGVNHEVRLPLADLSGHVLAILQGRQQFAVVVVQNLRLDPEDLGAVFHFGRALRASGPPAISWWPMSPLVTETNFTLCP